MRSDEEYDKHVDDLANFDFDLCPDLSERAPQGGGHIVWQEDFNLPVDPQGGIPLATAPRGEPPSSVPGGSPQKRRERRSPPSPDGPPAYSAGIRPPPSNSSDAPDPIQPVPPIWDLDVDDRLQALEEQDLCIPMTYVEKFADSMDPLVWEENRHAFLIGWFRVPLELLDPHPLGRAVNEEQVRFLVTEFTQQDSTRATNPKFFGCAVADWDAPWFDLLNGEEPDIRVPIAVDADFGARLKILMGNHRVHAARRYTSEDPESAWWTFEVHSQAIYTFSPLLIRSIVVSDNCNDERLAPTLSEVAASVLPLVEKLYSAIEGVVTTQVAVILKQHNISDRVMSKNTTLSYVCRFPGIVRTLVLLLGGPTGHEWRGRLEQVIKVIHNVKVPMFWYYMLLNAHMHACSADELGLVVDYEDLTAYNHRRSLAGLITFDSLQTVSHTSTVDASRLLDEFGINTKFNEAVCLSSGFFPALLFPQSFAPSTWVTTFSHTMAHLVRILYYLFYGAEAFSNLYKRRVVDYPMSLAHSADHTLFQQWSDNKALTQYVGEDPGIINNILDGDGVPGYRVTLRYLIGYAAGPFRQVLASEEERPERPNDGQKKQTRKLWIGDPRTAARDHNPTFQKHLENDQEFYRLMRGCEVQPGQEFPASTQEHPLVMPLMSPRETRAEHQRQLEAEAKRRREEQADAAVRVDQFSTLVAQKKAQLEAVQAQIEEAGEAARKAAMEQFELQKATVVSNIKAEIRRLKESNKEYRRNRKESGAAAEAAEVAAAEGATAEGADRGSDGGESDGEDQAARAKVMVAASQFSVADDDDDEPAAVDNPLDLLNMSAVSHFGLDQGLAENIMSILANLTSNQSQLLAQASREELADALQVVIDAKYDIAPRGRPHPTAKGKGKGKAGKGKRPRNQRSSDEDGLDSDIAATAGIEKKKKKKARISSKATVDSDSDEDDDEPTEGGGSE
ncbi:hypothetical protein FPV67DRAFT_1676635 [Lyophyllum atratum]|nr:hypothetical protein FPV67DRAFT_1676635 [Lyophyllum atratum]